ncbi:MAG: hypothetical protein JKY94_03470 [Rhodobacteraceae bacterium]|nr:hypothetical protein [Paracoccaceae bacterium]
MTSAKDLFTTCGGAIADAEQSQMFGKPCFKISGKAFVCFFQDCMVFKLTRDAHGTALSLTGALLFDPSGKGRAMKEWVQVPVEHAALWPDLTQSAWNYVRPAG